MSAANAAPSREAALDGLGSNLTLDAPTIGAIRRERGLPIPEPTPGLGRAGRLLDAGWSHFLHAFAHYVLAGRVTCGSEARFWLADELRRFADAITSGDLDADALADEMLRDAADHERRATRPWWPPLGDDDAPPFDDEAVAA